MWFLSCKLYIPHKITEKTDIPLKVKTKLSSVFFQLENRMKIENKQMYFFYYSDIIINGKLKPDTERLQTIIVTMNVISS